MGRSLIPFCSKQYINPQRSSSSCSSPVGTFSSLGVPPKASLGTITLNTESIKKERSAPQRRRNNLVVKHKARNQRLSFFLSNCTDCFYHTGKVKPLNFQFPLWRWPMPKKQGKEKAFTDKKTQITILFSLIFKVNCT